MGKEKGWEILVEEPIQVFSFNNCNLQLLTKGQWAREGGTSHLITQQVIFEIDRILEFK